MNKLELFKLLNHSKYTEAYVGNGDNVYLGLKLISRYFSKNKNIVTQTEHGVIYSVTGDDLIDASITEKDALKLKKLHWHFQDDYRLACFTNMLY